jgi:hypothetical protein
MKLLIFYTAWTFICSFFLKTGLSMLLDQNIGYWPAILITIFVQVSIVFPLGSVISTATEK